MRTLAKFLMLITLIATADAEAKVCFLPGVLNGDGCLADAFGGKCPSDYNRTTPCGEGFLEQVCHHNGTTYYRCSCRTDRVQDLEGGKYVCRGEWDSQCGCAGSDTYCNENRYPYESCVDYVGTNASGGSCRSPADGSVHYQDCTCSKSAYPYDCSETGLKAPSNVEYCEGTDGKRWYPFCICDDAWSTLECSSRTDGCTTLADRVYNGTDTCYLCGPETCKVDGQINLEAYWCNVTQTTETDCSILGYVKATKCDDGTIGVKCPFDSSYMYCPGQEESGDDDVCPAGSSSQYQTVEDCGTSGSAGWNIDTKKVISGNEVIVCGACAAKTCPAGSNISQICKSGQTAQATGNYAGNDACYKCAYTSCNAAGYSDNKYVENATCTTINVELAKGLTTCYVTCTCPKDAPYYWHGGCWNCTQWANDCINDCLTSGGGLWSEETCRNNCNAQISQCELASSTIFDHS